MIYSWILVNDLQVKCVIYSDNRIEFLPDDIFEDMPSLLTVELERNNLRTLKEAVWSSKIEDLNRVFLEGNDLFLLF